MTEGDRSRAGERPVRTVLYAEDSAARRQFAGYLEAAEGIELVEVRGESVPHGQLDESADCLVTTTVGGAARRWMREAVPAEVPVVLYTDREPAAVPDSGLEAVDSLVQQSGGQHRQFLVEKIRGVASDSARSRFQPVDAASLAGERADSAATFLVDDDGTVAWASDPFEAVFPETDTPAAAGFYERLAAVLADRPAAASDVLALRDSGEMREGVLLPIPLATGGRRDVVHCSYPLPDRASAARLERFEDLTVGRERTQRLTLFETLVMGAQDGLYTLDVSGAIDFCNPAMAEQLGYDREELLGTHASEVMADGELQRGQRIIQNLIDDPDRDSTVYDMVFVTKDGSRRDVSLHVQLLPAPDGAYAGLVGVMRDVTARKERRRELERFETIIQALGDPVYAVDDGGTIIYVNEAFEEQTGYDASEVLGEHGRIVLADESEQAMDDLVRRLLTSGRDTDTVELEVVPKDGERFPAEVHTALLPREDGEYSGNAGVVRDITERKRREERLEEFTSVVAHDLRSPLAVGQGNLDLYRETGDRQRLDKIEDAFDEMERLIENLLELARHGDVIGATEPVDLEATAGDAWQQLPTEDATLTCRNLDTVRADRARLRQALENLFGNAVEHGGSAVTVTVEGLAGGFAVADDGPGILPDRRDEIFERGYTTADEGTGFGLAIVEEIVDAHGWSIRVTESDAGGARFEITGTDDA